MEELLGELLGGLFGTLMERLGKGISAAFREQPHSSTTLKVSCEQCGSCFWAPEASLGQLCGSCRQGRLYRAYWFEQVTTPPPVPLFFPINKRIPPPSSRLLVPHRSNRFLSQQTLPRRRRRTRRRNQQRELL